ncbi:ElaD/SseL family deubiquitinase [Providencia vermicola]|uniref:ElaD/SseL family deubiquitinase n=1 Tax=Providencia vermicola TaxID=333965 RepID=UPI003D2D95F1
MQIKAPPAKQIAPRELHNLLIGKIDHQGLTALTQSASQGNLDDIDLLHNLALRSDELGHKAENILFDIFSGKIEGKEGIDLEIQKTSEKLYQLYKDGKIKNHLDNSKLKTRSKLLYIIGSTIEKLANKLDLTTLFIKNEPTGSTLWDPNRMTTSDEIDSANKNTKTLPNNVTVNCSLGLTQSGNNLLGEIIEEKRKNDAPFNQLELFPLNVNNNHWILFALYPATSQHIPLNNTIKCAVFNSYNKLSDDIRREIVLAAEKIDIAEKDITYIEGNIQQNVPNGCGLFVLEAIKQLTENHQQSPIETLERFHKNFAKKTTEEQEQFNIRSRRQLFSNYYDDAYQK